MDVKKTGHGHVEIVLGVSEENQIKAINKLNEVKVGGRVVVMTVDLVCKRVICLFG